MTRGGTGIPATGIMIAVIKLLLFLPSLWAAEKADINITIDPTPILWNVIIYLSSEMPNLSEDDQKYQQILDASQKNNDLHLTVLFDPIDPEKKVHLTTVHRGKIVRHQELEKPINFGDGETLKNFITDKLAPLDNPNQKVLYPATYYAFILSGDGGSDSSNNGWMPFSGTAEYRKIHINDPFSHSTPISVGYDGGSDLDSLTVYELDTVLTEIGSHLPRKKFDLIAFDACFMASLEVFYQLRNVSKYMVASESLTSSGSFPYLMLEHFESSPKSAAKAIVSEAFDLKNFPLTQFVAIDLDDFLKISHPAKRMTEELSILIYSGKLKAADLLNWRRESLLYADKKAAESINVDFNRLLFSIWKTADRLYQPELVKEIDSVQEIFEKSIIKRGTSELREVANEIRNKKGISDSDISRWAEMLKVDLNGVHLTTETFVSVVVQGNPIPRRSDLVSNPLVFNMLKILKKMIHGHTEVYSTDGLSIFFPDLVSEEIPTTDFTKIKLEDRLEEFYNYQSPFYSGLDFGADTGWLSFLKTYATLNQSPGDNEDKLHDVAASSFSKEMSAQ